MRTSVEHNIFSSFREWFEHILLDQGQAFFNYSSPLYPVVDTKLPFQTYAAPFYQWVFDESVSGAIVPSAASWGVPYIDYNNGRTLSGQPSGTVQYSVKELNVYTTTNSDVHLIFEQKYNLRPKPNSRPPVTGLAPYQVSAPCIWLRPERRETEDVAFGGRVCKKLYFSAVILSDDDFKRFGVGNLFCNKKNAVFPIFDSAPLNYYGAIKSGDYNYENKASAHNTPDRFVYVRDVKYTPVEVDSTTTKLPNYYFGKVYFECWFYDNLGHTLTPPNVIDPVDAILAEDANYFELE